MLKYAKRYEIYLPLYYNDGAEVELNKFNEVERQLVEKFGGVTSVQRQFPLKGIWRNSTKHIYQDLVIVFTVLDLNGANCQKFFRDFKEEPKQKFNQEEILITLHELKVV